MVPMSGTWQHVSELDSERVRGVGATAVLTFEAPCVRQSVTM